MRPCIQSVRRTDNLNSTASLGSSPHLFYLGNMSTSLKRTKSGIKTNQADENSSPDLRLDASSSNSDSDSEPSKPTKKAKRLTKPAVNFDASGDDSDLDYDDLAVNDAQKKSLAEKAKRRLSSKFGARKSLNPLNGRSVSISNLEGGGTPIKASSFSTNRSSPAVESVVGGGGGRVGALARARENQARNASRNSTGLQPPGPAGENRPMISTEVMNNNYDEWMKMATDNVRYFSWNLKPGLVNRSPALRRVNFWACHAESSLVVRKSMSTIRGLLPSLTTFMTCHFYAIPKLKEASISKKYSEFILLMAEYVTFLLICIYICSGIMYTGWMCEDLDFSCG